MDYGSFMTLRYERKNEVSNSKHVAFILTWISKFLSYNHLKKVTKAYLGTTLALANRRDMALYTFILNHIYKGMNDPFT